ncbi:MAG: TMEM143 family protein [Bacillus subtilis]|nr:TMEM143 family protein [Bacillus subtilis]
MIRFWVVTRWIDRLRLAIGALIGLAVIEWRIVAIEQAFIAFVIAAVINGLLFALAAYGSQRWYARRWTQFFRQPNGPKMRAFQEPIVNPKHSEPNRWPRVVAACDLAFAYIASGWIEHARRLLRTTREENRTLLDTNDLMRYRVLLQEANLDLVESGGVNAQTFADQFADLAEKVYLSHQDAVRRQVRFFSLIGQLHTLDWATALSALLTESGAESKQRHLMRMYVLSRFYRKNDNEAEAARIEQMYYDAAAGMVTTYSATEEPPLDWIITSPSRKYSPQSQRWAIIVTASAIGVVLVVSKLAASSEAALIWSSGFYGFCGLLSLFFRKRFDNHRLVSILIFLVFAVAFGFASGF